MHRIVMISAYDVKFTLMSGFKSEKDAEDVCIDMSWAYVEL